ncbi:hypothetical protein TNCV_1088691 [Trichonephila clavipes]|uniref:Uncharacterized protein n=1 Tax=Trichonephila clavipes TaxID=2585209 RepID=A0A8X6VQ34_TRICX|nr:hypothetical protein TNCV_1088691 [Trichonephila clavipes]
MRVLVKAVTPKCLGGPPVDRDRLNAHPDRTMMKQFWLEEIDGSLIHWVNRGSLSFSVSRNGHRQSNVKIGALPEWLSQHLICPLYPSDS